MRRLDELLDINPKFWLSKYRKTTLPYLIKMGIFYLALGLALQQVGNILAEHLITNYQIPSVPISITMGFTSGPLEEATFFGLPFYLNGNYLAVLAGGILWSVLHIFNTHDFALTNLAYGSVFFTIPHIFFSLRTWISGKGWFAILFHTAWNAIVLGVQCISGVNCIIIGNGLYFFLDLLSVFAVVFLIIALHRMHRYRERIHRQP
ncbi:MAG: CAAX protease [Thaumarchaeota archaeon]|nr:MAG: CAAX protease [Nitrososphaerota archaeon]